MRWKIWLKFIGLILLIYLLLSLDWYQAIQVILRMDPTYIAGYFLCFVGMLLVKTIRLRIALLRLGYPFSFFQSYEAVLEPVLLGLVTPGRLGEFARIGYIRNKGVSMQEAICLVAIERLIDVYILFLLGVSGVMYIFLTPPYNLCAAAIMALGLFLALTAIRKYDSTFWLVRRCFKWLLYWEPLSWINKYKSNFDTFRIVFKSTAAQIFLLGLACSLLNILQILFLAKAFSFNHEYLVIIFAYAASSLVALMPISVGGLGTRDVTYLLIMDRIGIPKDQAILFSFMDGVFLVFIGIFLLMIPIWVLRFCRR